MENPGDSPQATRKRVWRFVFGSLFVVALVAFWPLKGYKIDEDRFLKSLGPPYFGGSYFAGFPVGDRDDGRVCCQSMLIWSRRSFQNHFEEQVKTQTVAASEWRDDGLTRNEVPGIGLNAFAWKWSDPGRRETEGIKFLWYYRNVYGIGTIRYTKLPPGKSREQMALDVRDALAVLRDGIEREIPGVTTFYNPPARQLWIDRVRPFLSERFPKLFPSPIKWKSI